MQAYSTQDFIDEILAAIPADRSGPRERHTLRQTLQGLVRHAKLEQRAQIRADSLKAAGLPERAVSQRQARLVLKRFAPEARRKTQQELEFGGDS